MRIEFLSKVEINKIHTAFLDILNTVGVKIPHADMRKRLAARGAVVDEATQVVKLPEPAVRRALDATVKQFRIYGRDRARTASFGHGARRSRRRRREKFPCHAPHRRYNDRRPCVRRTCHHRNSSHGLGTASRPDGRLRSLRPPLPDRARPAGDLRRAREP